MAHNVLRGWPMNISLYQAASALEGNLHLRAPSGTPMANAFVSLLQALGHDDIQHFGDSTGEFPLTFPRGVGVSQVGA